MRHLRSLLDPVVLSVRDRLIRGPIVLAYHRILRLETDPQLLAVSPEHFRDHLAWLTTHTHLLSLSDLADSMHGSRIPRDGVVVTFDDGYADNLSEAKPLLEHFEVPATVFVATGLVDKSLEFWWDETEHMILHPGQLPRYLHANIAGTHVSADLAEFANYTAAQFDRFKSWNELATPPTPRHDLYRSLHRALRSATTSEREHSMDYLRTWAGVGPATRQSHRILSSDELRHLDSSAAIEVGAHTVNHPWLAALSENVQNDEMRGSKKQLEAILGRKVDSFSYPFGSPDAYGVDAPRIAQEVGFSSACANVEGRVWRNTNPWRLPRYLVRDWSADTFARRVERWMNG